jgi:hypothetical protein
MKYERMEYFGYKVNSSFFILHFSFKFSEAKFIGRAASRAFRPLASGYPLHHLHALPLVGRFGGSATIPLAKAHLWCAIARFARF